MSDMFNSPLGSQINITSQSIVAQPRSMKAVWSTQAADDLRALWGPLGPLQPTNALDLLYDSQVDPDYDPDAAGDYKGLFRWPDGRIATPEEIKTAYGATESLVASMADEIKAEIDREVMSALRGL